MKFIPNHDRNLYSCSLTLFSSSSFDILVTFWATNLKCGLVMLRKMVSEVLLDHLSKTSAHSMPGGSIWLDFFFFFPLGKWPLTAVHPKQTCFLSSAWIVPICSSHSFEHHVWKIQFGNLLSSDHISSDTKLWLFTLLSREMDLKRLHRILDINPEISEDRIQ